MPAFFVKLAAPAAVEVEDAAQRSETPFIRRLPFNAIRVAEAGGF